MTPRYPAVQHDFHDKASMDFYDPYPRCSVYGLNVPTFGSSFGGQNVGKDTSHMDGMGVCDLHSWCFKDTKDLTLWFFLKIQLASWI